MSDFKGLYDIRDFKIEDKNLILATFLRGLYYGDSWFSLIPKPVFMANYKQMGELLVTKAVIKVACLKDDPNVILGYSILSQDYQTIHWCFVKAKWRGKGIARSLLPQHPSAVSHLTELGKTLMTRFPNVIFNPFLIN